MSSQLQDALGMFAFLAIELSVLFIGISLLVGVLQRHIPPSKVEALLTSSGKRGYFLAAGLGAITPFCSCSTIPMLKGLIRARAGFGPMMVFLFSSPLLNPIVVGLLVATFGWTLTAIYVLAALVVAVGAGWLLHTLGFERYVRRTATQESSGCSSSASPCSATSTASSCDGATSSRPAPCPPHPHSRGCGAPAPPARARSTPSRLRPGHPLMKARRTGARWRNAPARVPCPGPADVPVSCRLPAERSCVEYGESGHQ